MGESLYIGRVVDEVAIRMRFEAMAGHLDERGLRLWAAGEARAAGRGGVSAVSRATGLARSTINRGLDELEHGGADVPVGRVRRHGGGRKAATVKQPGLLKALKTGKGCGGIDVLKGLPNGGVVTRSNAHKFKAEWPG